ncbi:MAG: ribonuclease H-like domain-containing protein, partial [Vicinamibacterales bacterium]
MAAWSADAGMHVYHFGHYEPSALKRLMGRYAARADELDQLLRAERFVDLHAVVRQALRAGVESYSIKRLEQFYEFGRDVPLGDVTAHLQAIELALESNAIASVTDDVRAAVRAYNRDDCRSTEALREWLERLRADVRSQGAAVPRPQPKEGAPNAKVFAIEQRQEAARARLLDGVSADAARPDHAQHPYWLLAYLLDWHRREDKSQYWERYRLAEMSDEDLLEERQAISGLEVVERGARERYKNGNIKSAIDRYRYPYQEVELGRSGELRIPGNEVIGSIADHDRIARTIHIKKGREFHDVDPTAVFQAIVFSTDVQQEALLRLVDDAHIESCGTDLLFRRPPRLRCGDFRQRDGETAGQFAVRLATDLGRT